MNRSNDVQLITYVDRLGGGDIKALNALFSNQLKGVFGGVHLLAFFSFCHTHFWAMFSIYLKD